MCCNIKIITTGLKHDLTYALVKVYCETGQDGPGIVYGAGEICNPVTTHDKCLRTTANTLVRKPQIHGTVLILISDDVELINYVSTSYAKTNDSLVLRNGNIHIRLIRVVPLRIYRVLISPNISIFDFNAVK